MGKNVFVQYLCLYYICNVFNNQRIKYTTAKQNISWHIKIFDEDKLGKDSTVEEFLKVKKEENRNVERKVVLIWSNATKLKPNTENDLSWIIIKKSL